MTGEPETLSDKRAEGVGRSEGMFQVRVFQKVDVQE